MTRAKTLNNKQQIDNIDFSLIVANTERNRQYGSAISNILHGFTYIGKHYKILQRLYLCSIFSDLVYS